MLSKLKDKSSLFLASSLCDGLEDNNINQVKILLLSKGADPNVIVPIYGKAPFHFIIGNSSEKFSEQVTILFLQYGGNPNVKSIDGMTPVHFASALGRINILKLLLDAGGDPLAVDNNQKTPFDYAFDGSYYGAIALLSKYYPSVKMFGENINETGEDDDPNDDEDEDDKSALQKNAIKIKLEKILVNKGNFVAEYVPSEIDATFENTNTTKQLNDNYTNQLLSDSRELNLTRDFDESHTSHYHSFNSNFNNNLSLYNLKEEEKENKYCHVMEKIDNNNINTNEFHKKKLKPQTTPLVFNTSIVSKSPNFNIVNIKKEGKTMNYNKNKGNEVKNSLDMEESVLAGDKKYNYASPITTRAREKWWTSKELKYEQVDDTFVQNNLNPKQLSRVSFDEFNDTPNNLTYVIVRDEKVLDSDAASSSQEMVHPFFSSPDSISQKNYSKVKENSNDTEVLRELEESLYEDRGPTPLATVSWYPTEDNSLNYLFTEDSTLISDETTESKIHPQSDVDDLQSSIRSPNAETTFYSVDEEYAYVDSVKNVAFLERRLRVLSPGLDVDEMDMAKTETSWIKKLEELTLESSRTEAQTSSSSFDRLSIDDVTLRQRLTALGQVPGPITSTTYRVYLKRLCKLERKGVKKIEEYQQAIGENEEQKKNPVSAIPLRLLSTDWIEKYKFYRDLEDKAFHEFQQPDLKRKYRGGNAKVSFNYLLLDPRITNDLPRNGRLLSIEERWKIFLGGIFYIGKGKSARSAAHLYDAFDYWMGKNNNNTNKEASKKIKKILDIWRDKKGVVCLHVFINTIQEEAFTREAAMIDALGTNYLSNCNKGNYYGVMSTMSNQDKKSLGKFLLYKAMEIFMYEGERQLFPKNVE